MIEDEAKRYWKELTAQYYKSYTYKHFVWFPLGSFAAICVPRPKAPKCWKRLAPNRTAITRYGRTASIYGTVRRNHRRKPHLCPL